MLAGFLSGYLAYDCIHCALHARRGKGGGWRLLARLRRHHTAHHYRCRALTCGPRTPHLRLTVHSLGPQCLFLGSSAFMPWVLSVHSLVPLGRATMLYWAGMLEVSAVR